MSQVELCIPFDHPTAAGHFPGNPIIPGALLLAEIVRLIGDGAKIPLDVCNIKSAKFFHPVRPGDTVRVEFSVSAQQEIRFQCAVGETSVLSGAIHG